MSRSPCILSTNSIPHKKKYLSTQAGSFSLGSDAYFLAIEKSRSVFVLQARVFETFQLSRGTFVWSELKSHGKTVPWAVFLTVLRTVLRKCQT